MNKTAHLVQFFLPVRGNDGKAFPREEFARVRAELADRFGGVTAYVRSPAVGAWEDDDGDVCRDDVLLFEVVADTLDRDWWRDYRDDLCGRFAQEEVLVRASKVELI
ncbi:hypothetical protein [Xenophilus sp.]|uniref:hypothetical protein n=1 Tax=Xenophilus sp. TaxID=1873499 RepID=UPI0037DD4265